MHFLTIPLRKWRSWAILILLLSPGLLWAQFQYTADGFNNDRMTAGVFTNQGEYVFLWENDNTTPAADIFLTKTTASGVEIWTRRIFSNVPAPGLGMQQEIARDVIQTQDQGFVVVGSTSGFDNFLPGVPQEDVLVVKFDVNGVFQWSRMYGNENENRAISVVEAANGDLLLTGYNFIPPGPANFGNECPFFLRIDANGAPIANLTYSGIQEDRGRFIVHDQPTGRTWIVGFTQSNGPTPGPTVFNQDLFILEVAFDGSPISYQVFNTPSQDFPGSAQLAADGTLLVGGRTQSWPGGVEGFVLKTLTAHTGVDFYKSIGTAGGDQFHPLEISAGNYMAWGVATNTLTGLDVTYLPFTATTAGVGLPGIAYGSPAQDQPARTILRPGRIASFGGTAGFGITPPNVYMIETNLNGIACDSLPIALNVVDRPILDFPRNILDTTIMDFYIANIDGLTIDPADSLLCVNPCTAASDPQYLNFSGLTPTTITADVIWPDKVYVDDNHTVIVDGVTLDITNADVVFGTGAQLQFINGAMLRANNSVFRPCLKDGTWLGVDFLSQSAGLVHESTFKNAETALEITDSSQVKITNNLFLNCNTGVFIDPLLPLPIAFYEEPITGNTFELDENVPAFTGPIFFGVLVQNARLNGQLSQNDFINGTLDLFPTAFTPTFFGIELVGSRGNITHNNFTNVQIAIADIAAGVGQIGNTEISWNEIEYNRNIPDQVVVGIATNANQTPVLVEGNRISYTESPGFGGTTFTIGIFTGNSTNYLALSNEISGFDEGIRAVGMTMCDLQDNSVENCINFGIRAINCPSDFGVRENVIEMNNSGTIGINYTLGTLVGYDENTVELSRNCIFESGIALQLTSPGCPQLPVITHNFLYTYTAAGMQFNAWGTSALGGSPAGPPVNWARNSFVANNGGGTDIVNNNGFCAGPLFSGVNYVQGGGGTYTTVGPWAIPFPAFFRKRGSYAKCGSQIDDLGRTAGSGAQAMLDMLERYHPVHATGTALELDADPFATLADLAPDQRRTSLLGLLGALSAHADAHAVGQLITAARSHDGLTADDKGMLEFHFQKANGQLAAAKTALDGIAATDGALADLAVIEGIQLDRALQGRPANVLDQAQQAMLEVVDANDGMYRNYARAVLRAGNSDFDFYIEPLEKGPIPSYENEAQEAESTPSLLFAHPSLVTDRVTIDVLDADFEGGDLRLYDVRGVLVRVHPLAAGELRAVIDMSMLSAGIYQLALHTSEGQLSAIKLVKD